MCAAAAITGGVLSSSAFGTGDEERPAAAKPSTASPPADSAGTATDETTFEHGVMTVKAATAPHTAAAATRGEGWKLAGPGKWLPTGYTIKFHDQKSVDWLAPYVKRSAADLRRITHLPVTVDTEPVGWDYKRPKGEVTIDVLKRPCLPPADGGSGPWKVVHDGSGIKNLSCGFYSSSVADTVTSGHAYIDSSFFSAEGKPLPSWGETMMRNHISHEIAHTLGMDHANRSARKGDCAVGVDSGEKPVMCSPAADAYQDKRAGTYVQQFDLQGLRHLAKNTGATLSPQGKVTGIGGKCLDVKGGKAANGTQIQVFRCHGKASQSWLLEQDGTFRANGKCLDDAGNAATDGNKIQLSDCTGKASQKWSVNAKGQIVHVASGKVLDVTGGSTADSTKVQLHSANSYKRQVWVTPK